MRWCRRQARSNYSKTLLREAGTDLRKHPRLTLIQKRIDSLVRNIKFCNEMLPKRHQVDPKAVQDEELASPS